MCGIVGLFLKDEGLESSLGQLLTGMLVTLSDRGPDSAGIAVYEAKPSNHDKLTVQSAQPDVDFPALASRLEREQGLQVGLRRVDTHAVLSCAGADLGKLEALLQGEFPQLRTMSRGNRIEIFKEKGLPSDVAEAFDVPAMAGSHGIGHTRMATESAVTTLGAHPFSTGPDQCLVHNGSLSNHNFLRRELQREGLRFETENDTEVAAAYLSWKLKQGANLGEALEASIEDLDGFYTFLVGTETGFGVLRDPIACKPAVLAETEQYVAFGSEYRALAGLPGVEQAKVWEPEPATVYFWER